MQKLLAQSEREYHKPTISHYRDMENGLTNGFISESLKDVFSRKHGNKYLFDKQAFQANIEWIDRHGKLKTITRKIYAKDKTDAQNRLKKMFQGLKSVKKITVTQIKNGATATVKNPNLTKLQRCQQIIAESKREKHKPTISHYRDMENPSNIIKEAFKKVESLDRQVLAASKKYLKTGKIEDKQKLFELEKQQNNAYTSLRNLTKTFNSKNPTSSARTATGKNPITEAQFRRTIQTEKDKLKKMLSVRTKEIKSLEKQNRFFDMAHLDRYYKSRIKEQEDYINSLEKLIGVKNPTSSAKPTTAKNPSNSKARQTYAKLQSTVRMVEKYRKANFTYAQIANILAGKANIKQAIEIVKSKAKNPTSKTVKRVANAPIYKWLREDVKRLSLTTIKRYIESIEHDLQNKSFTPSGVSDLETRLRIYKAEYNRRKKPNFTTNDFKQHISKTVQSNSQMFQGATNGEKVKLVYPNGTPKGQSRLGELKQIIVKMPNGQRAKLLFNNAFLSMDARKNLHIGGKTKGAITINGIRVTGNGLGELGEILQIDYQTAKKHINGGKETYFYHKLGEATGEKPKLYVDTERLPRIIGGNYDVWGVGIVN